MNTENARFQLNSNVVAVLESYDWPSLHTCMDDASKVPDRLKRLILAVDAEEADHWENMLDNHIVVQGACYDSAPCSLHVLIEAIRTQSLSDAALFAIYDLIHQTLYGYDADLKQTKDGTTAAAKCRTYVLANWELLVAKATTTTVGYLKDFEDRIRVPLYGWPSESKGKDGTAFSPVS